MPNYHRFLSQENWQYFNVFVFRYVVKIPKTRLQIWSAINQSRWKQQKIIYKKNLVNETFKRRQRSWQLLKKNGELAKICQVVCLLPFGLIIQRRGATYLELLNHNELTIDVLALNYAELCVKLWNIGVFEACFDFLRNCGMLSNGMSFYIDVGDFHESRDSALATVENAPWKKRVDYLSLSKSQRDSFDEVVTSCINRINLASNWRKK